jgi:hypothetical protein
MSNTHACVMHVHMQMSKQFDGYRADYTAMVKEMLGVKSENTDLQKTSAAQLAELQRCKEELAQVRACNLKVVHQGWLIQLWAHNVIVIIRVHPVRRSLHAFSIRRASKHTYAHMSVL